VEYGHAGRKGPGNAPDAAAFVTTGEVRLDRLGLTPPLLAATLALGANAATAATAVDRATALVRTHAAALHAASADRFAARGHALVDADGTEHVRFDRTYAGLPVIGGDVVVHSRQGRLRSLSQTQAATLKLDTHPSLVASEALVIAGTRFGADFTGHPAPTLVVHARGPGAARLAWQVRLANDGADTTYLVDANDGRVLDQWSNRPTVASAGTGRTLYSGAVALTTDSVPTGFAMRDPTRGGASVIDASNSRTSGQVYTDADNTWGNHAVTDKASAAADAQYGAAVTWDYYRAAHGRLGIAGNGLAARSRVHYGFRYANAYWNDGCFCMTYGDGDGVNVGPLVALDIAGHEMSHGVNATTANLIYSRESGGLNEANSDILGTLVEFHANNPSDTPDYLIGEEIFLGNVSGSADQRALRYLFKPSRDGRSPDCYAPTLGDLDVHYSSGVANLFFYLLAEGSSTKVFSGVAHAPATCNGATLAGIGRAKAGKIWYRALTVYFTSSTNYAGARLGTIAAARDLYGAGSAEAAAVAAAWSAVKVN
jgi:Zn-dependent metalloprotease